ncbi:MAG: hypothetical protein ABIJ96_06195 [Elusimicrobiota bacterium]
MRLRIVLALASLCAGNAAPSPASSWDPVPRRILALHNPPAGVDAARAPAFHPLHLHAELPLNYLGMEVEYVDASRPLPDVGDLADVRGIITWFSAPKAFADPSPVCRWLSKAMARGIRVALLGELGLYSTEYPYQLSPACAAALRTMGLEANGNAHVSPLAVSISSSSSLLGFERRPDLSEMGHVPLIKPLAGARVHMQLALLDSSQETTAPVLLSRAGGVALHPFVLYANKQLKPAQLRWVIDPFKFFEEAFGLAGLPRPDATTLSGRRVFFSHINGDGFYNPSEIERQKLSAELFFSDIIERYPASPVTVALVAGYFDMQLYNDSASIELARRMLGRAHVEPAAHGYAQPLVWNEDKVALQIPRYSMDVRKEIVGSARMIEKIILPGGGRVGLFQWTGDCLPAENDILIAENANLLHINGGGGRYDRRHPSYAYLYPLGRRIGKVRQIYAAQFNENNYTGGGTARAYGYRDVIETFKRTGSSRRVKPVNIHAQIYSAQKFAALKALRQVVDWALSQPLTPVFTSRYVRSARAFYDMRVSRRGLRRFLLAGGQDLRTVRFDDIAGVPDLRASRGVIGYRREGGSLYVALDESDRREIVLADRPYPGVFLDNANFELANWRPAEEEVRFRMRGWWTPEFTLGGLRPGGAYRVASPGFNGTLAADAEGKLRVLFSAAAEGGIAGEVAVERAP